VCDRRLQGFGKWFLRLVGVAGDFVLPPIQHSAVRKLLFVAGGIGVTPFPSMFKAVRGRGGERDVVLSISAKEPKVLLGLVAGAISPPSAKLKLSCTSSHRGKSLTWAPPAQG